MTTPWIIAFDEALPEGTEPAQALGGKGASLQAMTRAGLAVPPGFIIRPTACAWYYEHDKTWPPGLAEELRRHLERLEATTGRRFGQGARPLLVSVRSGAAVSMPGMMDTILNCGLHAGLAKVTGDTPWFWDRYRHFLAACAKSVPGLPAGLLSAPAGGDRAGVEAWFATYRAATGRDFPADPWHSLRFCIEAVFASWQSDRARTYRERHRLDGLAGTAVTIQMMFPSQRSGVVFTEDPTGTSSGQVVIEASYGLGESVVSGEVTPDRFLVDRQDHRRQQQILGHKATQVAAFGIEIDLDPDAPSLDPAQVAELTALALRVEAHYGHPVDIEWGWAEGRFALLQARRIRGLNVLRQVEPLRQREIARLRARQAQRPTVWVAHNLGETLPHPTPLTWDLVRGFMAGDGGYGRLFQHLGYRPSPEIRREGFLELILGRIYADPQRLAGLFYHGLPLTYDLAAVRQDPGLLDRAPGVFVPEHADVHFLLSLPANLRALWRTWRRTSRLRRTVLHDYTSVHLPAFRAWVTAAAARDLDRMDGPALLAELEERRRRTLVEFAPLSLAPGYCGGLALADLESELHLIAGDDGRALARRLTMALPGDTTVEQQIHLMQVGRGTRPLATWLDDYGHRAAGEMELMVPRFADRPEAVATQACTLAQGRVDPEALHHEHQQARVQAEAELAPLLARHGGASQEERIRRHLATAQALLPYREAGKHHLMLGYALIRQAIEGLRRRHDLDEAIYFLHYAELPHLADRRQALLELAAERRLHHQTEARLEVAPVITAENLDRLGQGAEVGDGDTLTGTAMAPGLATGIARLVTDPGDPGAFREGDVLVCASTDPGWAPLLVQARALVVERGGVLSHGAIVARDFGIPAVACPGALRRIADGQRMTVDGQHGVVRLLGGNDHD